MAALHILAPFQVDETKSKRLEDILSLSSVGDRVDRRKDAPFQAKLH